MSRTPAQQRAEDLAKLPLQVPKLLQFMADEQQQVTRVVFRKETEIIDTVIDLPWTTVKQIAADVLTREVKAVARAGQRHILSPE